MEWVETTGKSVDEARDRALEELGVAEEDAEVEVVDEPKAGLFGLIRGEARVRARVRPTEVRPKIDRRRTRRSNQAGRDQAGRDQSGATATADTGADDTDDESAGEVPARRGTDGRDRDGNGRAGNGRAGRRGRGASDAGSDSGSDGESVDPAAVGAAAVGFVEGLVDAFSLDAEVRLEADGTELDVHVDGTELGLLIGPGGRTLLAVQDLARVAAQRRLGDHETRLRVDVAGYRERRREALERFARTVAEQVISTGRARSMEPMPSADRKVVHDVLVTIDGVTSHSEGDDPDRRVVVTPA